MKMSRSLVLGAVLVAALACGGSVAWAGGSARSAPAPVTHAASSVAAPSAASNYVPITQCREVDTRYASVNQGPIAGGTTRDFAFSGDPSSLTSQGGQYGCVVPSNATAIQVVITATGGTGAGFLEAWATDQSFPGTSVLSFNNIDDTSSAATLAVNQGGLRVEAEGAATNLSIDVDGYYLPTPEFLTGAINYDGSLNSGPHITKSVLVGGTQYQITFDRDIQACAFTLTSNSGAVPFGGPQFYSPDDNNIYNTLLVSWTVFGSPNLPFEQTAFNLTGICPV